MGKEIVSSETIKLLDETIDIAEKVLKNQLKFSYEQCAKDIEAQWRTMIQFSSLDDLLLLHIKSLQSYRAKIADEYNKQQNDYRLERQRNCLTIICSIIGVVGVVVGVVLTFILKQ